MQYVDIIFDTRTFYIDEDVQFIDCTFENCVFEGRHKVTFQKCELIHCDFLGDIDCIELTGCTVCNLLMKDCRINRLDAKDTVFDGSLQNCIFRGVSLSGDLQTINLCNTKINKSLTLEQCCIEAYYIIRVENSECGQYSFSYPGRDKFQSGDFSQNFTIEYDEYMTGIENND